MADGLSTTNADLALTAIVGSNAVYVQLHTGAPGSAGTANVSSVTTREAQAWGSASAGEVAASDTPTWSSWAGTDPETVTDISHWSIATGGTFGFSVALGSSVTMHTGDTLEITSDTVSITPAS